jgi:hypothetical protein
MKLTQKKLYKLIEQMLNEKEKNWDGNTGEPLSDKAKAQCAKHPDCAEEWLKGAKEKEKNWDGNTGEPLSDKAKAQCAKHPDCAEEWLKGGGTDDPLAALEKKQQEIQQQHKQRMKEMALERQQMNKAFKVEQAIQQKQLEAIGKRDMDTFEKLDAVLKKVRQLNRNDKFEEAIALAQQL